MTVNDLLAGEGEQAIQLASRSDEVGWRVVRESGTRLLLGE